MLTGPGGVSGEVMGEDLNENVVLHRDDAGKLYEIEVVGNASEVIDLSRLYVEGLPAGVFPRDQDGKQPTKTFSPDEPFYCIVELSNAPDDTKVKAVWTAVKAEDAQPNTFIDNATAKGGSGEIQFNLTNQAPGRPATTRWIST